jgi:hypothetical protein
VGDPSHLEKVGALAHLENLPHLLLDDDHSRSEEPVDLGQLLKSFSNQRRRQARRSMTTLAALGRATLDFSYKITRKNDGQILAEGWTRHACVDSRGKVARIAPRLEVILKTALVGKT